MVNVNALWNGASLSERPLRVKGKISEMRRCLAALAGVSQTHPRYQANATHSISISKGIGHEPTVTKLRAGGSSAKYSR